MTDLLSAAKHARQHMVGRTEQDCIAMKDLDAAISATERRQAECAYHKSPVRFENGTLAYYCPGCGKRLRDE
jgi:hypothetical protein